MPDQPTTEELASAVDTLTRAVKAKGGRVASFRIDYDDRGASFAAPGLIELAAHLAPAEWRKPTDEDRGEMVEVSNDGKEWLLRKLVVMHGGYFHCENPTDDRSLYPWPEARIRATPPPANPWEGKGLGEIVLATKSGRIKPGRWRMPGWNEAYVTVNRLGFDLYSPGKEGMWSVSILTATDWLPVEGGGGVSTESEVE